MADNPGSEAAAANAFRSVDAGITLEHGLPAAFVHHQIGRWCAYNKAEGIDAVKIDGAHWMYISHERLQAALPWYNVRTIRRAIETLNRAQLLHKRLRKGTETERSGSPAALLYRAIKYVDAGVDRMSRGGGQNVHVRGGQNVHVEYSNLEPEKKSADLKDQTTSAKARSKEAAVSHERVNARSKGENRTTTGPQPQVVDRLDETNKRIDAWNEIAPAIDEERQAAIDACKATLRSEQQPLYRAVPFTAEQTRYFAEAQAETIAGILAETHDTLVPDLRNVVAMLLDSRVVPQNIRGPIEAGRRGEYKYAVLYAWYVLLDALPKQPMVIEAPIGLGHEAAG